MEDESGMSLDSSVNMSSVGAPGSAVSKPDQQAQQPQQQPPEANSPLPPSLSDRLAIAGGATADGDGDGADGKMRADGNGGVGVGVGVGGRSSAAAAATGGGAQQDSLVWNVEETRTALRGATAQLGRRGLKLAAKWAAEQVVGLPPPHPGTSSAGSGQEMLSSTSSSPSSSGSDLELHARTLLECGEYRAAASTLSGPPVNPSGDAAAASSAAAAAVTATANAGGASVRKMKNNRAAANRAALSTSSSGVGGDLIIGPPLEGLSPFGTYLRAYSLYMAGERRKEEEVVELRDPLDRASARNAVLPQLAAELYIPYAEETLDAFGLYIYGIVLKALRSSAAPAGLTTRSPTSVMYDHEQSELAAEGGRVAGGLAAHYPAAHSVLIESLLLYPYNWSAWLDLSELCIDDPAIHPDVEDRLRPISGHWMYHFFCVHVFLENQANENAVAVIERLVNGNATDGVGAGADEADIDAIRQVFHPDGMFVRSPYLQSQLAVAHYNLRDFDEAQAHFVALAERYPDRLDQMDVYSNILYVKEDRVTLSALAHRAVRVDKYRPETCCIVGNYYSLRGRHERAVTYFQRALKLDPSYLSAWTLMGHEYVEMKNTAAAVEAYRRAVDINPRDYRAWYGLGQTYEILDMLLYSLFYYRRAATLRPYDARMWCAMGSCYLGLGRRADAMRSYERAVSNHDAEGIATKKLAELYKDDGDTEGAARCYLRHLELRFQAQGGSGGIEETDGQASVDGDPMPSIESIINLVEVDAAEAEALLFLGYYHRDNGEYETAASCCSRLLEYPGKEKEEGKALLREIRSLMDKKKGNGMTLRSRSRSRSTSRSPRARRTPSGNRRGGTNANDSMDMSGSEVQESSFEFSP